MPQKTREKKQTTLAHPLTKLRVHRLGVEYFIYIVTGFAAANAFLLGGLAPFGIALAASAKKSNSAPAVIGATLGYLFAYNRPGNMKYVIAMALLALMIWGIGVGDHPRRARILQQVYAGVSLAVPSIALAYTTGGTVYDLVLIVAELFLSGCALYFFARTAQAFELGIENIRQTDITSIIITFCIAIISLSNITFFGLSVGRILAVTVILVAAQYAKEAGGAIAGVAGGVASGIIGGPYSFLMGTYALGGLLAGVFAPMGKAASAAAFITVNCFALLASHQLIATNLLIEIALAGGISMLVPLSKLRKAVPVKVGVSEPVQPDIYKAILANRIGYVSGALRDVAKTTRKVNEHMEQMVSGDISTVYHCAADRVCRNCKRNADCWQAHFTDTCNILNNAVQKLRSCDILAVEDYPPYFANTCPHLEELTGQISHLFEEYASKETMRRKMTQVRGVVTDQFEGMALVIDAMGTELGELKTQDKVAAAKITEYLGTLKIYPESVNCTLDQGANMTAEIKIPSYKLSRIDMEQTTLRLSDICEREFDLPVRCDHSDGSTVTLSFAEKARYSIKWGAYQIGSEGAKLCGDSYSYVSGRGGRINLILSDGMGSGGHAALDSTMTSELLKRLIEAGVSLDAALRLVNSALLVKTGDESLATIDITGIDLYTGQVEFYKAGAAPTFVRKSGKGGYIESSSLPVGILGNVSFDKNALTLREDDMVVMVSDGAVASGYEWILSDLEHYEGTDPQAFSEALATEAARRRSDGHEDDITVIAVRLGKGI